MTAADACPTSTYRVQLRPGFGFDDVAALAGHLAALGVTHVYLSPVLEATPGSTHGYDVVDHDLLSTQAGGREAFDRMTAALSAQGLSAVADVVPNHMAVPTPVRLNHALWSVLRDGPASPFADWFDVDWSVPDRAVLMPVLGDRIGTALVRGEITVDRTGAEPVLRYFDKEFPIRPGTDTLPLEELVDRQWYRLAWWRVADEELNYRRFFDVDTLAAVRVEHPEVFDLTHRVLVDLVASGALTGLRIDHPDGLADPRGYLDRLAEATGGTWVVVEKIVEGDESLPADWACAGTTGYDALMRVGGVFVDPAGAAPLDRLLVELTGETESFDAVVDQAKREVVEQSLYAEVHRLTDLVFETCHADVALRDHPRRHLQAALVELLVAFDRYRAYVVPDEPAPAEQVAVVEAAAVRAREKLPEEAREALDVVVDLVLARPTGTLAFDGREAARRRELAVRFQQTCGPVMAKGVEDTAFYRWHRLVALNEVGGDPTHFGVPPEEFHAYAARLARDWPATMTTLSTHDTKRSEDVRARLAGLSELTEEWAEAVRGWTEQALRFRSSEGHPDPATQYLLWQTLVGTWDGDPIPLDRLGPYLEKATREAKRYTWWTRPDPAYDEAVQGYAAAVLGDEALLGDVARFDALLDPVARVNTLGQKLTQLTMPGVPDVYQGCETVDLSLVDPDNRRDVDFDDRRDRLARLDAGEKPQDLGDEKLLVTSRALRLRRDHPDWFAGPASGYAPVGTTTGNALAFARGPRIGNGNGDGAAPTPSAVTVVTRLPVALERHGGWGDHTIFVPEGQWRDVLTGVTVDGGAVRLADLLEALPVALLVREG
ncbi:malto-oligosyltrehalose synthase [Kineosporia sp. R_H_3]|uniref:malto-oligosyltrehalose synthase n=1 Tax=Kineosporia sp. R_H_3 TaxID=1961848 RepID=UPI000B4B8EA4|nr:malto-oligosyltrehalose synthase [Kineosporia sp. R_H_3]